MPPRAVPAPTPADYFWAAPPFSRTVTVLSLIVSLLVYSKLLHPFWVLFLPSQLLAIPPQIWRLFSSFLLTGPQFGIIYDPYFLYTYGSRLETASPRFARPADFYSYIIFIWATILGLNFIFTGAHSFMSAMILAFTYTSCLDDRLAKANFFILTIPAPWIPFAMIMLTLVMDGPYSAMVQTIGLVAAHLHFFLTEIWPTFGGGTNYVQTPAFITRLFATTVPQVIRRAYGTAVRRPDQPLDNGNSGSSTGASSAVLPESWRSRGAGHRLGGD